MLPDDGALVPGEVWVASRGPESVSVASHGPEIVSVASRGSEIVSVASRGPEIVSVASRVVNPKHDELRPMVSKELYQLHRKIQVYKMSNNLKVLIQFYCTLFYA